MPQRYECKDYLTLYTAAAGGWQQAVHVGVGTSDAEDLAWAPNARYLAVWDSCLEYRCVVMEGLRLGGAGAGSAVMFRSHLIVLELLAQDAATKQASHITELCVYS
jgi:hypothetical protein